MINYRDQPFMLKRLIVWFVFLPRKVVISCVKLYQRTLSPDYGALRGMFPYGYCRHSPTCSQYAVEQLTQRGAIIGTLLAAWRVLHCNPFVKPSEKRMEEAVRRALENDK